MRDVVFFLHRVYPEGGRDDISLKNFVRALKMIKTRFKVVPLHALFEEKDTVPRAAITFDDGYADNFVYAYPVLKELGIPAHIFITSRRILESGRRKNLLDYREGKAAFNELFRPKSMFDAHVEFIRKGKSEEFLSWEELDSMRDVFTFGAHGKFHFSHPVSSEVVDFYDGSNFHWSMLLYEAEPFVGLPLFKTRSSLSGRGFIPNPELIAFCRDFPKEGNWKEKLLSELKNFDSPGRFESEEEAKERIGRELQESKEEIESRLGVKVDTFAWPFGHYSEFSKSIASGLFQFIFTIKKGLVSEESDRKELPRVSIGKDIFTVLGRLITFSTDIGFSLYKRFKGDKVL